VLYSFTLYFTVHHLINTVVYSFTGIFLSLLTALVCSHQVQKLVMLWILELCYYLMIYFWGFFFVLFWFEWMLVKCWSLGCAQIELENMATKGFSPSEKRSQNYNFWKSISIELFLSNFIYYLANSCTLPSSLSWIPFQWSKRLKLWAIKEKYEIMKQISFYQFSLPDDIVRIHIMLLKHWGCLLTSHCWAG